MSEVETAAPSSTADIAASVIHEAEATDTSSADPGETARLDTTNTVEETAPVQKTEPTAKELSDAAKFLQKQGHQAKKVDGRDVWLPYKTVEGMLDRYVETHKTTWDGERTTLSGQAKELQSHIEQLRASVAGDETAFLRELATIDPRYSRFLDEQKAEQPKVLAAADDPMPQPDFDLGNGNTTYTLKGLQARDEWVKRQMMRDLEGKIEERFKPIAEREKAEKERAEQAKAVEAIDNRTKQQLTDAETWPGWSEHKQEILVALQDDSAQAKANGTKPSLSLEGAYRKVVVAKLLEDDGKKRERLLQEIQASSKTPALSRQTTDNPRTSGPRSTTDIARSVITKLESQA